MMALLQTVARIDATLPGREHVIPHPFKGCFRILDIGANTVVAEAAGLANPVEQLGGARLGGWRGGRLRGG
jgi:hypothetical protein